MRLDLLIATLRRPALLRRALDSLARAARPATLDVAVCVINNVTSPALPQLDAVGASLSYPLIHEPRPGSVIQWARTLLVGGSAATRLAAELPLWQLACQLYGTRMHGTSPTAPPRAPTPGGHPLPTL
jgi:hypothetical protein